MLSRFFIGAFLLVPCLALAHIPPVHWQIKRLTENRPAFQSAIVDITVLKPAQNNSSSDEPLGTQKIYYSSRAKWPALSLLLEASPQSLHQAWRAFGPNAPLEQDLLVMKPEQYKALENPPRPFYKDNPQLALKRFPGGIAYVSMTDDKTRSIWIERNSYRPLSLRGPCPSGVSKLPWARGKSQECSIDYERTSLPKFDGKRTFRLTLRNANQDLLIFRIDSVRFNPSENDKKQLEASINLESSAQNVFDTIFK